MRIRLRLLLPLAVGLLVALAFLAAAVAVGGAVRESLLTIPGLTRERAVEAAVHAVVLVGTAATLAALAGSAVIARIIAAPLSRVREAALALTEAGVAGRAGTRVAEIQDVARGLDQAGEELRARHGRVSRERTELAALLHAVSEGLIQLDPDGRIMRTNPAAHRLLGIPDEAVGRPVASVVRHPELRRLMERGARGARVEPAEAVVDERRVLVSVADQAGGGAVATVVDLTDLRRLEEIRRDFVANASHELKTPLTSIRGYAETLLDAELAPSDQRQFLATIARNAGRLQRIVDDLLDLSRLESGGWTPALDSVDVAELARRGWDAIADRAAQRTVTFEADAAPDLPPALADASALEQVFANLYDNALRHTPAGGRIAVSIREPRGEEVAEANARWIAVEVADTGSGIPRDALPRIFERFYRVDPARSRSEGGTGLGLSIVRHLIERMGGSVAARSELGKGTTIRFLLRAAGETREGGGAGPR